MKGSFERPTIFDYLNITYMFGTLYDNMSPEWLPNLSIDRIETVTKNASTQMIISDENGKIIFFKTAPCFNCVKKTKEKRLCTTLFIRNDQHVRQNEQNERIDVTFSDILGLQVIRF